MKKEIIKIKIKLPVIKIGDIVQFNNLAPVKAVKYKDCSKCCYCNNCSDSFRYCDYISEGKAVNDLVMFKMIKEKP